MGSNKPTQDPTSTEHIAVKFVYDEKHKQLNAILSGTPARDTINRDSLRDKLLIDGFDHFIVADAMLDKVMHAVDSQESGLIKLAEKPVFVGLSFEIDNENKVVMAVLSESEQDTHITLASLPVIIQEAGFDPKTVTPTAMETIHKQIQNHKFGKVILCPKPNYTALEFVVDDRSRELSAVLSHSDTNTHITAGSLQDRINKEGFSDYQFTYLTLPDLLQLIRDNKQGTYKLAGCPSYAQIKYAYDPDTRKLSAIISESARGPDPSADEIRKTLREKYTSFKLNDGALDQLLKRIENKKFGKFDVGAKPEYTSIDLVFDKSTGCLNAVLKATDREQNLSSMALQTDIIDRGFEKFHIESNAIDKIIETAKRNDRGVFALAQRKNAEISITVSKDEMEASISTTPAFGGMEINEARLIASIEEAGIDKRRCDKKILRSVMTEPSVTHVVFCRGLRPSDGTDSRFEALVEEFYYREVKESRSGKIDLNDRMEYTLVEPNMPLMRRIPATEGIEGFTVKGKSIPSKAGIEIKFNKDLPCTTLSPDDENLLLAEQKGHPVILADGVRVDQTLIVNNVSPGTGNITFDGSLLVKGDVMSGMSIDVTGDILVRGVATNANIKAGNNITVNIGIVGTEPIEFSEEDIYNFTPTYSAGGTICAKYITLTRMQAGECIKAREYMSHCLARAKSCILIGQDGGNGSLFGGECHAEGGVSVNLLGSDSGMRTMINAGHVGNAQERLDAFEAQLANRKKEEQQLDGIFKKYLVIVRASPTDPAKLKKLKVINTTIAALKRDIDRIISEIGKLKQHMILTRDADIAVVKRAYPNAHININEATFQIRQESKGGRFTKFGSEIRWGNLK